MGLLPCMFVLVPNGWQACPGEFARPTARASHARGRQVPGRRFSPSLRLASEPVPSFAAAHAAYGLWGYAGLGAERSPPGICQQLKRRRHWRNGLAQELFDSFASTGAVAQLW